MGLLPDQGKRKTSASDGGSSRVLGRNLCFARIYALLPSTVNGIPGSGSCTGRRRSIGYVAMKNSQGGSTPFSQLLGMRCISREKGLAHYEMEVGTDHLNRRGVAHGGVVASLLDTALGASVVSTLTPEEWTGTLELSVQF